MASDSNIESSIPDIESEASLSSQSISKSLIWSKIHEFCRMVPEGEERNAQGKLLYHCNQCEYKTTTSNFRHHYKSKHKIVIESKGKEHRTTRANEELQLVIDQLQNSDLGNKILRETLDKKVIETALLELLIVQNLPFRIVESLEF